MALLPETGIAAIRLGDLGLNFSRNPSRIPPQALIEANGIIFTDDTVQKEPGASLFDQNTTAPAGQRTIKALFDWRPTEAKQRLVHLAGDGKIYQTTDAAPNDIDAASSAVVAAGAQAPVFVQGGEEDAAGNRKLFLFSGSSPVVFLDGNTTVASPLPAPPLDWASSYPVFGVAHGNRIWAGGNLSDPHRIYASSPVDHGFFLDRGLMSGDPSLTFADVPGGQDTITRATGSWITDGFSAGQSISVTGSSDNNNIFLVASVSATVLTLDETASLTDEAGVSGVTIVTSGAGGNGLDFGVGVGVGERLWAGASHKGMLFLWKYPRGVYWLDDSDVNTAGWRIRQVTDSIGCAPTPHAVLQLDDGFIFMAPDGSFYYLEATTQGGITVRSLSESMQLDYYIEQNVNKAALANTISVWYPRRRMAIFIVPKINESLPTLRFMFDFRRIEQTGLPRFSVSDRDTATAIMTRRNPSTNVATPFFGDDLGNVYEMEQVAWNKNDAAYSSYFRTPNDDFSAVEPELANYNKIYRFIALEYIPSVASTLTLDLFVDGGQKQPIPVALIAAGTGLGTFTLDTHTLAADDNLVAVEKLLNVGEGRRISVKGTSAAKNEGFNLTNIYIGYQRGSRRLTQG